MDRTHNLIFTGAYKVFYDPRYWQAESSIELGRFYTNKKMCVQSLVVFITCGTYPFCIIGHLTRIKKARWISRCIYNSGHLLHNQSLKSIHGDQIFNQVCYLMQKQYHAKFILHNLRVLKIYVESSRCPKL